MDTRASKGIQQQSEPPMLVNLNLKVNVLVGQIYCEKKKSESNSIAKKQVVMDHDGPLGPVGLTHSCSVGAFPWCGAKAGLEVKLTG